jgi:hypothetical protein
LNGDIIVSEHITSRLSGKGKITKRPSKCARKTLDENAKRDWVRTFVFLLHYDNNATGMTSGATGGDIAPQSKRRRERLNFSLLVRRDDETCRRKPPKKSSPDV